MKSFYQVNHDQMIRLYDVAKDLAEIDQTVRSALNFVTTDHVDKILDVAFAHRLRKKKPAKSVKSEPHGAELRQ